MTLASMLQRGNSYSNSHNFSLQLPADNDGVNDRIGTL